NENFLDLQNQLTEIEDQIQYSRRYYNGTVRNYNIRVESFPNNVIAGIFKFKPEDFFEITFSTERKTPEVKL
ncbi:MAG: LemA family protein, partial [Ignavibacteriaceae bacterium]|nr:LemA family protein [Ignavibacteriaceae bacterium]